jgi:AcrR family transcriptional regulator
MGIRAKPSAQAKRSYHSPRREEQARATRKAILDAAQRLFQREGYVATSMAAIAEQAGVSLKTVYVVFETKSGLFRALWHRSLRRGDEETPVADQPWFREVLEASDPKEALRLNARNSRQVKERIAPLGSVLLSAAAADPEIDALSERIWTEFYENQLEVVKGLNRRKALKPGLTVKRAADVLWTLNHPRVYLLLVEDRGWSPEEYQRWFADISCEQLLA